MLFRTSISAHPALLSPNHLSGTLTHTHAHTQSIVLPINLFWQSGCHGNGLRGLNKTSSMRKKEVQIRYMDKCINWLSLRDTQKPDVNSCLVDRWGAHDEQSNWQREKMCLKTVRKPVLKNEGSRVDKYEEKVIKLGFRQAFMGSETQTPFEAVRRFWAYNSDNSDWRKM